MSLCIWICTGCFWSLCRYVAPRCIVCSCYISKKKFDMHAMKLIWLPYFIFRMHTGFTLSQWRNKLSMLLQFMSMCIWICISGRWLYALCRYVVPRRKVCFVAVWLKIYTLQCWIKIPICHWRFNYSCFLHDDRL